MVSINYALREVSCKIVYYGPGLSGKTTNLQFVHGRVPSSSRGELISLATEADRTLYFDFLPVDVGQIAGFTTKFQLYTVPGQVFYDATRRLVLRGVDGLVFVADSQVSKMDENIESLNNMFENLNECGIAPDSLPLVFQWNKRDLPDVFSVSFLEEKLNPRGLPSFEAIATTGVGVFDTLKKITKIVLEDARARTTSRAPSVSPVAAPSPALPLPPVERPVPAVVGHDAVPVAGRQKPDIIGPDPVSAPARDRVSAAKITATEAARQKEQAPPAAQAVKIHRAPSLKVRRKTTAAQSPRVYRAQKSLKVRQKKKSSFARLFRRLFGR